MNIKNILFSAILLNTLFSYSCIAAITESELKRAKATVKVDTLVRVGAGTVGGAVGAGLVAVVGSSLINKKDTQKAEIVQAILGGFLLGLCSTIASMMAEANDELHDANEQRRKEFEEDLKRRN